MSDGLSMRGVSKSYRAGVRGCSATVSVLRDLDLDVAAGEIVGVTSAPAGGKTTLLMCAAGLLRPDQGSISWFGGPPRREPSARPNGVAYAGDRLFPYGFLTVREALEYAAIVRDLPLRGNADRVTSALERTGLAASFDRRVDGLDSVGVARLSLASALLAQPRLLLVDALSAACDPDAALQLVTLLRAVAADGAAVVVAGALVHWLCAPPHQGARTTRLLVLESGRLLPTADDTAVLRRIGAALAHARVAEAPRQPAGLESRTRS